MEEMKVFNKWSTSGIRLKDFGLEKYINLDSRIVPLSGGRLAKKQFHKSKMNIVERLANKMQVPGHHGKKHIFTSGRASGKTIIHYKIIEQAFEKIEHQVKKNPIEVLVQAIENSAPREEITQYQVGGIMLRRAVITAPQRRVDLALSNIVQAAYKKSFGKKDTMVDALITEIVGAFNNDAQKSEAIKEKERHEREAEGAR
jgi:small subunit ribosomal protein S7